MPKVNLPTADWDWIRMLLEDNPGFVSDPLLDRLNRQLDKQEN